MLSLRFPTFRGRWADRATIGLSRHAWQRVRRQRPGRQARGLKPPTRTRLRAARRTSHLTHRPRDQPFKKKKISLPLKKKKKKTARKRARDYTSQKPLVPHAATVLRRRRQGQTDTSVTWILISQPGLNLIFFPLAPPSGAVVRSDRSKMATVEPVSVAFGPHPHRAPRSVSLPTTGLRGTAFPARTPSLAAPSPSSWA